MVARTLEETIETRIDQARDALSQKLYKQWLKCDDDTEANKIGAQKHALDGVVRELKKALKGVEQLLDSINNLAYKEVYYDHRLY